MREILIMNGKHTPRKTHFQYSLCSKRFCWFTLTPLSCNPFCFHFFSDPYHDSSRNPNSGQNFRRRTQLLLCPAYFPIKHQSLAAKCLQNQPDAEAFQWWWNTKVGQTRRGNFSNVFMIALNPDPLQSEWKRASLPVDVVLHLFSSWFPHLQIIFYYAKHLVKCWITGETTFTLSVCSGSAL